MAIWDRTQRWECGCPLLSSLPRAAGRADEARAALCERRTPVKMPWGDIGAGLGHKHSKDCGNSAPPGLAAPRLGFTAKELTEDKGKHSF